MYEAERQRLYDLLTAGGAALHTADSRLEAEAAERAFEARNQVGLTATGTTSDAIKHPTQTQCEARLGPEWRGKGVGEIATWNYLYADPVKAAADGLLNSPVHRKILDDPSFVYWGAGIYTELPEGSTNELHRRWYFIVWLSKQIPTHEPRFEDVPFTHLFWGDIEWAAVEGIARGFPDGTFHPDEPVTRGQLMAFLHRLET